MSPYMFVCWQWRNSDNPFGSKLGSSNGPPPPFYFAYSNFLVFVFCSHSEDSIFPNDFAKYKHEQKRHPQNEQQVTLFLFFFFYFLALYLFVCLSHFVPTGMKLFNGLAISGLADKYFIFMKSIHIPFSPRFINLPLRCGKLDRSL